MIRTFPPKGSRDWIGLAAAMLALGCWTPSLAADAARPQYGTWGFDLSGMDRATAPGDDFFRYANGGYQDRLIMPPDRSSYSPRAAEMERTEANVHELLEAAAKAEGPPDGDLVKVGAFYAAFMDEAKVEALGASPLKASLDQVRQAGTREALARLMGTSNATFDGALFGMAIQPDLRDSTHYAIYLSQAGLGLPNRDYYSDAAFAGQKASYQAYVARLLGLIDWPEAAARAKDVVELETRIAAVSWSGAQQRDADATYNPMGLAELSALAPGFDWRAYLAGAGLGAADRVVVVEKSAFPRIAAIYASTPVEVLEAWMAFQVADNAAVYLSEPFATASFDFHDKTLSGQPEQPARWKRAVHAVSGGGGGDRANGFGTMGLAVGQLYTARYFPPASKAKVEALVSKLKVAFRARIEALDWMAPETKAEALRKLDACRIKVGYPDTPRDYSALRISRDDLVGDVLRAAASDWELRVRQFGGPVDQGEWLTTPQTNGAYHGAYLNDIVFTAAILTPPIFDPNADPAVNYGAVGAVIGHELTHGFDDQGRKFDAAGRLRDWWTATDARTFEARAARLGAQYSSYEPLPGARVNGALTMGENIADLGGVTLALDAYHASLGGKPAPAIDGLTGDQRVFLGWAQSWRGKLRDDALRRQVATDPHSPRQYRVDGSVRNIDAWYGAFGVKPGDKLYLKPEDRVRIW